MKKQLTQKQKLSVIESGADIGMTEAAKIAGVHVTLALFMTGQSNLKCLEERLFSNIKHLVQDAG